MSFQDWIVKGQELWDKVPGPIKTIINVTVGAAIAAGAVYLKSLNGGPVDIHLLWAAVFTGATTAFWRAINPFDATYGWGRNLLSSQTGAEITGIPDDTTPPEEVVVVDEHIDPAPIDPPVEDPGVA